MVMVVMMMRGRGVAGVWDLMTGVLCVDYVRLSGLDSGVCEGRRGGCATGCNVRMLSRPWDGGFWAG